MNSIRLALLMIFTPFVVIAADGDLSWIPLECCATSQSTSSWTVPTACCSLASQIGLENDDMSIQEKMCTQNLEGLFRDRNVGISDLKSEPCLPGTDTCTIRESLLKIQGGNKGKNKINLPQMHKCSKPLARCLRARGIGLDRIGGFKKRCISAPAGETKVSIYKKTNGTCVTDDGKNYRVSLHSTGLALDIFNRSNDFSRLKKPDDIQRKTGDDLTAWLIQHAASYGIVRIIWNRKLYESDSNFQERRYSGADDRPHYDHVHVEVSPGCTF